MPDLIRAALDAAAQGWHVFPLRPGDKRPALHGETACPHSGACADGHVKWEQRATTNPQRIRAAWAAGAFNIGVATGPSGLIVVDLDMPKDKDSSDTPCGVTTFAALCERAGTDVPATRTVRTAGGGMHLYFTAPPGARLGNTARRLGPLVDTRAWGGYVVAPGSTINGAAYEVLDPAPVAPLAGWLREALRPPERPSAPTAAAPVGNLPGYIAAALRNETANVASAPEGSRNWTLTRAARALGRFIASGDLPRTVAEQALKGAGETAGLTERECTATITSALNWSIAHNSAGQAA